MSDRKLIPAEKRKYSLEEKESQRQLCKRYKEEYNAKIPKSWTTMIKWRHTKKTPRKGHIRMFYSDLKEAIRNGKRCYKQL